MTSKQKRDLLGLVLLAATIFLVLSLVPAWILPGVAGSSGNLMGMVGAGLTRAGTRLLGVGWPLIPALPALAAATCFGWISAARGVSWGAAVLAFAMLLPAGAALFTEELAPNLAFLPPPAGGWIGTALSVPLMALVGWIGALLVILLLAIIVPIVTLGLNPAEAVVRSAVRMAGAIAGVVSRRRERNGRRRPGREPASVASSRALDPAPREPAPEPFSPVGDVEPEPATAAVATKSPAPRRRAPAAPREEPALADDFGDPTSDELPTTDLLDPPPPRDTSLSERELDRLGQILMETLQTFKVQGEIVGRTTGPVVTQFEVVPAAGIKVNRIAALDADLALALKAASVRIVAPIPGKGAVGVEVPNPEPEVVYLRQVLESPAFQRSRGQLPLALGKDLHGRPYVADLARMPHLLIAGATGSGKSVCINTLITSLIYRHPPRSLRLLMIDPKMVELSMYADLPHLRHPVVTNPREAATVLKWAVYEMERRYALLSANGVRSLGEFNRRVAEGHPLRKGPVAPGEEPVRYEDGPLPYIVVVVDELADLMMSVQNEIERPLAQLAQKARAIGIHLIVATQRPSVNVITGLIKANFPCRIAFRVSSKVDSRTILDQNGADALLGNGDMLFLPPGQSDPVRIQGVYLSTEETERLMAWYRSRGLTKPELEEDILEIVRAQEEEQADEGLGDVPADRDPLFRQAAEVCIQFQQGSTSLLQRRLRIGYGRAARIIDQLHHAGVLGPPDGPKPREVLVGMDALDLIDGMR